MKRFIALVLAMVLISSSSATYVFAADQLNAERLVGDVDNDGIISISDATCVQMLVAHFFLADEESERYADVDGSGSVSVVDVTGIQRYLVELDSTDFIGKPYVQKLYTVEFRDYDNALLLSEQVVENSAALLPENPVRSGYIFTNWFSNNIDYRNISGNCVFVAEYIADTANNIFVVDSKTVSAGEEFTVNINLQGTVKLINFELELTYDSDLLEVVSFGDEEETVVINHISDSSCILMNYSRTTNRTRNQKLTEVTFRVKPDVQTADTGLNLNVSNVVYVDNNDYITIDSTPVTGWVHIR